MSAWAVPGYTEERELGHGASARVVAATRDDTGQQVAIKYLAPRLLRDPNFLARFREEVELLASIDVPHVVRLFDYVEAPGQGAAIVMELVDGVSLHEMITRQGPTSPESALVVLKGSLLGLAAAHQLGIVHRDYKPENVLVDGAGNSKLTDFGVAVKAGERAPVGGTPLYMAPEQWNGEPATPATDIYAATAVFFECLTGQTPFSGRLEHLAMQHQTAEIPVALVDQPLQALIERGLAKDPRDRPAHAVEFVAELNEVADSAYGDDWEERGGNELAKRAAALLLLLLGGIAGAAGGSFAATLLGGMGRRKKAVVAGAALGIFAAIAVTTTTLALTGNNSSGSPGASATNRAADAVATNPGAGGTTGTGSPPASPSTTGSPTASPSTTGSPTASPSATSPTTNPPATSAPTTNPAHYRAASAAGHHGGGVEPGRGLGYLPGRAAIAHRARDDQLRSRDNRHLPLGPLQPDQHRACAGENPRRRDGQRPGLGDGGVEPVGDHRHARGDVAVRAQRQRDGQRPVRLSDADDAQSGHPAARDRRAIQPVTHALRRQRPVQLVGDRHPGTRAELQRRRDHGHPHHGGPVPRHHHRHRYRGITPVGLGVVHHRPARADHLTVQLGSPGCCTISTIETISSTEPNATRAYRTPGSLNELPMPTRKSTAARNTVIRT